MTPQFLRFHSSTRFDKPMATDTRDPPPPLWERIWNACAHIAILLMAMFLAMLWCWMFAPPFDEPRPEVSYLPEVSDE